MEALLIRARNRLDSALASADELIERLLPAKVLEAESIEEAIEEYRNRADFVVELIVVDASVGGRDSLQALLQASSGTPCIVFAEASASLGERPARSGAAPVVWVDQLLGIDGVRSAILDLVGQGGLSIPETPDAHFIEISPETLLKSTPLKAPVFIRLSRDGYVKLMNTGDTFTAEDAETYGVERQKDQFYLHRDDAPLLLGKQVDLLKRIEHDPRMSDSAALLRASAESLEVIHQVTQKIGFSAEVQELAKKSTEITLQAIGTAPNLADAVRLVKLGEGKYITSHSLMLAEISCCVAYASGWESAGTFVKLVMASMLHDLQLKDHALARIADLHPEKVSSLTPRQVREVRLHPVTASEFARKLAGLPADVDRIIIQHHERPDGSGYPRGLFHNNIDPLAACFIISHELLDFVLLNPDQAEPVLPAFLESAKGRFTQGNFKRIATAMGSASLPKR